MSWLFLFLKGFAMGTANVIPGVSGGTIAFITGIFERIINCLKSFDMVALRHLKGGKLKDLAKHIDLNFLIVLGLGVAISIFTTARIIQWAYKHHEINTSAVFFGLIAISLYSLAKLVKKWSPANLFSFVVGCAVAVGLAFIEQAGENKDYLYLAVCGAVAMCSMILPGVSGSFVLMLMGNYLLLLNAINDLRVLHFDKALPIMIPFGIGAILGVAMFSRFLSWLFKKYHDFSTALVTGFVAGSLYVIWPWKSPILLSGVEKAAGYKRYFPDFTSQETWITISFIVAGAVLVVVLEIFGRGKKKEGKEN
jgi:putative membrane protein